MPDWTDYIKDPRTWLNPAGAASRWAEQKDEEEAARKQREELARKTGASQQADSAAATEIFYALAAGFLQNAEKARAGAVPLQRAIEAANAHARGLPPEGYPLRVEATRAALRSAQAERASATGPAQTLCDMKVRAKEIVARAAEEGGEIAFIPEIPTEAPPPTAATAGEASAARLARLRKEAEAARAAAQKAAKAAKKRRTLLGIEDGTSGYAILGATVEEDLAEVGERVRPWLWVLSVFGFGMLIQRTLEDRS